MEQLESWVWKGNWDANSETVIELIITDDLNFYSDFIEFVKQSAESLEPFDDGDLDIILRIGDLKVAYIFNQEIRSLKHILTQYIENHPDNVYQIQGEHIYDLTNYTPENHDFKKSKNLSEVYKNMENVLFDYIINTKFDDISEKKNELFYYLLSKSVKFNAFFYSDLFASFMKDHPRNYEIISLLTSDHIDPRIKSTIIQTLCMKVKDHDLVNLIKKELKKRPEKNVSLMQTLQYSMKFLNESV